MIYRAIGLMSGSSLDGLDVVFAELTQAQGKWRYQVEAAECLPYDAAWTTRLKGATQLSARDYMALHAAYGRYLADQVNDFIDRNQLWHRVQLIGSHGHTAFHDPASHFTTQLGCGASLAAGTGINVVSDLRQMDVALGGQGAPIVPAGEQGLMPGYDFYLNLGGIANVSINRENYLAFDVCPANRVLNLLAADEGMDYDKDGALAARGALIPDLLEKLNGDDYYRQPAPKSLANELGSEVHYPMLKNTNAATADLLATYVEHIAVQLADALKPFAGQEETSMLVTGGGAFNTYLMQRIEQYLSPLRIRPVVPDAQTIAYKEALIMAFLGVLRWREENTVLHSVTGASRSSIGGAVWIGQEA